jgi:porin
VVSNNANLFVNSTFAWPESTSADLPSGGPNYPLATPGVRLKTSPVDDVTVRAAIFNGDPAGSGVGQSGATGFVLTEFPCQRSASAHQRDRVRAAIRARWSTSAKLGGFVKLGRFPDAPYVLQALAEGDVLNCGLPGP